MTDIFSLFNKPKSPVDYTAVRVTLANPEMIKGLSLIHI